MVMALPASKSQVDFTLLSLPAAPFKDKRGGITTHACLVAVRSTQLPRHLGRPDNWMVSRAPEHSVTEQRLGRRVLSVLLAAGSWTLC